MAITLRQVTGSALSFAQVDENFSSFYYSSSVAGSTLTLFRTGSSPYGLPITSESINIAGVSVWTASLGDTITRDGNVRITGSLNQGISNRVSGNYSHAEGRLTTASGDFSHAEGYFTEASATGSHAEGYFTDSTGDYSHAEGDNTQASGYASHAEGKTTVASATGSHAEGESTSASGPSSHAEGLSTVASGSYSHTEGISTIARAIGSHAEGTFTTASGDYSHAEGYFTVASGSYQHVQGQYNLSSSAQSAFIVGNGLSTTSRSNLIFASGSQVQITGSLRVRGSITGSLFGTASSALTASYAMNVVASKPGGASDSIQINKNGAFAGSPNFTFDTVTNKTTLIGSLTNGSSTQAIGVFSHAEGVSTSATGDYSHAEGASSNANGIGAHAEGLSTAATGNYSHAEGQNTVASGQNSHAEGEETISSGEYAHAEGTTTIASGNYSHAEGEGTTSSGDYSHAEGAYTVSSGPNSHAEGNTTIASGNYSHAEGQNTISLGSYSHAEGQNTISLGNYSHAEGRLTTSSGLYSHAEGRGTLASGYASHAEGTLTIAAGIASHAEGSRVSTGTNKAYQVANIVAGLLTFVNTYGDISSQFTAGGLLLLNDNVTYGKAVYTIASSTYIAPNTKVQLVDTGINSATSVTVGNLSYGVVGWTGNVTYGGSNSHAEGSGSATLGAGSHAEGHGTHAVGDLSHTEGLRTITVGVGSHAEGSGSLTLGTGSHAEGLGTVAQGHYQHVQGQYNASSSAQSAFIVGNGLTNTNRSNLIFASGSQVQITGSLNVGGGITGSLLGTASFASTASYVINEPGVNTPGGLSTTIQFNKAGVFSGSANLTYIDSTNTIQLTGSLATGLSTVASGNYQHVVGQFNQSSSIQSVFIVGNGTSNTNRRNLIFASGSQVQVTGSLNVNGGITGSLLGTASYVTGSIFTGANSVVSSSYSVSSSYIFQAVSASFSTTASYALNAGGATTPQGAVNTIQFNKAGAFSGSANLTYIDSTNTVELTGSLNLSGSVVISGSSGNILFSDSGTTKRGVQGTVGGNDHWFVGGGALGSDQGFMEIATGDNGNQSGLADPIYVSQYGPGSPLQGITPATQATLLDRNGDTFFPGNFTVSKSLSVRTTAITGSLTVSDSTTLVGNNTITGSLSISGSTTINDILILTPRTTTPTQATTATGSIMLSGSSGTNLNLYVYTGTGAIGNGWSKITVS